MSAEDILALYDPVGFGCSPGLTGTTPPAGADETGDRAGGTILAGMARDGIASVTIRYPASGRRPAQTITSTVINNVYVLKIPPRTAHASTPMQVILRDRHGRVVTPSSGNLVQMRSG